MRQQHCQSKIIPERPLSVPLHNHRMRTEYYKEEHLEDNNIF